MRKFLNINFNYLGLAFTFLILLSSFVAFLFCPAIPQPLEYHNFADKRSVLGIPYFYNVISNIGFIIIGVQGVMHTSYPAFQSFQEEREKLIYRLFFLSTILGGIGSAYYHLHPNNITLLWDRLPMMLAFISMVSAIIAERFSVHLGYQCFMPFIIVSIGSLIYWEYTEIRGHGDLRLFGLIQLWISIFVPLILWNRPNSYSGNTYLWQAVIGLGLARTTEIFDHGIYVMTNHLVSGHTFKHIFLTFSAFTILKYLKKRHVVRKANL